MSYGLDYFSDYEKGELQPSACTQLDVVGRQPHSRDYLEYESNCARSKHKFYKTTHEVIEHPEGIQFSGRP